VVGDGGEDVLERLRAVADAVEAIHRSKESVAVVRSIIGDNFEDYCTDRPDVFPTNASDNAYF
jgi:hypothetical protein